jgi:hypothetical protein
MELHDKQEDIAKANKDRLGKEAEADQARRQKARAADGEGMSPVKKHVCGYAALK